MQSYNTYDESSQGKVVMQNPKYLFQPLSIHFLELPQLHHSTQEQSLQLYIREYGIDT